MHFFIKYLFNHKTRWKVFFVLVLLLLGAEGIFLSARLYPQTFSPVVSAEKTAKLSLTEPFAIDFSGSMIPQTFNGRIKIYPAAEFSTSWQNHNRKLVITPKKSWNPETGYQVSFDGVRSILLVKKNWVLNFKTVAYPQVSDFFPAAGSRDVLLDIEDPITVTFNGSVQDFKIKIAIDPEVELESQLDLTNNQLKLITKNELEKGKTYAVKVFIRGLNENDSVYREIYQSAFSTKPNLPTVWEKDFALRLEQAKFSTAPQIKEGKYIDINTKTQVMTIFENGQALDAYLISSGKRGMDTPQGTFAIANKTPRAWSKAYGLFMPFWMALVPSGKFGIHELPEWPSGYKEGTNHLGTPVSHGCVRLGIGPAQRVYDWTEIGTPVVVHS